MIELGLAVDGGKDSLSMATRVPHPDGSTETVKSPLELVVSAYAAMADVTNVATPDIKRPGKSVLIHVDLSGGQRRLGGSALAQAYGQLGNECPDVPPNRWVINGTFDAIQELVRNGLILSVHDVSDGGLIVALLEMAFSGNCGFKVEMECPVGQEAAALFAEEPGWVLECATDKVDEVMQELIMNTGSPCRSLELGETTVDKSVIIRSNPPVGASRVVLNMGMVSLRHIWEETSFQLEKLQTNPACVADEQKNVFDIADMPYELSFNPEATRQARLLQAKRPKVAIIREEGSNGDREMAAFFAAAGFECVDVHMSDLIDNGTPLSAFQGLAFVGGFSYGDVLDSAKGWAAGILFNETVREAFDDFYRRPDTFSLSVCNGCQLAALLGWIPKEDPNHRNRIRFIKNDSGRFESRFLSVRILESPAIMLSGMAGSSLGIWSAHGEGKFHSNEDAFAYIEANELAPLRYLDDFGVITERYPFNPNGSRSGIAAVCDKSGRHLAMMPHPERSFLKWQWAYMPEEWKQKLTASPWLKMTQNAYDWCLKNKSV